MERVLHWARSRPEAVYLTQPYPGGRIEDCRWCDVADPARRMAAYLQSLSHLSQPAK